MNGFRISAAIVAALASVALTAAAQGTTTTDPKKTPKAEETKDQKKMDPPKADAKKAAPAKAPDKAADKKAAPKKAPAKAPPKKVDTKAQATGQGGTVQKYEAGKAPDLKDAKGNTVPTSPDAYDISSATAPPKNPPKKK
jgi:hypothetical protein